MTSIGNMKPRQFVKEFQKRAGLLIDGKPGPQTQMALEFVPELPPGRIYPAVPELPEHLRTTPTPIDPADIRPGDVFRVTYEATCERIVGKSTIRDVNGEMYEIDVPGATWHLVHRRDARPRWHGGRRVDREATMSIHDDPPREGTPIDPADIRPGDVLRRIDSNEYVVKGRCEGDCLDTNWGHTKPGPGGWLLVSRPDPDAEVVEALGRWLHDAMSACQDPYGTCITTTEYFREKAKAIIEFQRGAES